MADGAVGFALVSEPPEGVDFLPTSEKILCRAKCLTNKLSPVIVGMGRKTDLTEHWMADILESFLQPEILTVMAAIPTHKY
jgi:hypothetical protein